MDKKFKGSVSLILGVGFLMNFWIIHQIQGIPLHAQKLGRLIPNLFFIIAGVGLIFLGVLYWFEPSNSESMQRKTAGSTLAEGSRKYCDNCGAELPEGAEYCIKCGRKIPS